MKRWRSLLVGVVVSILMLAYALNGVHLDQVGSVLAQGRYIFVIPSVLFGVIGLWLRGMRWRSLLNDKITPGHSFNLLNASFIFNAVLPFRLGEVVRAFLATRLDPPIAAFTVLSTVVVEQLTNVLGVVVLVVIAVFITPKGNAGSANGLQTVEVGALISTVVAVVGTLFLIFLATRRELAHRLLAVVLRALPFLERLNFRTWLDHILDGLTPLTSPRTAGAVLGWTTLAWIASIIQSMALLYVFYDQPLLTGALLFTAVSALAVAVPAVPGNVGPFEATIVFGLTAGGMVIAGDPVLGTSRALAFAALLHLVSIGLYAFLGIWGLSQERISLGEVLRTARGIASNSTAQTSAAAQPVQPEG